MAKGIFIEGMQKPTYCGRHCMFADRSRCYDCILIDNRGAVRVLPVERSGDPAHRLTVIAGSLVQQQNSGLHIRRREVQILQLPPRKEMRKMESIIALLISVACMAGAFMVGVSHGRDQAYDEAFDNALRTINEVYEEEVWNR